jgi:sigma-E factor negative regulatory protein RseA
MDKNLTQREQLSALADGQLEGGAWEQAMQCAHDEDGRSTWNLYHLVGDVLRSPELAQHADNGAFLQRLQLRLADEPVPGRPAQDSLQTVVPPPAPAAQAANAPVFYWKMVAGLASVAAVAVVGWSSWGSLQTAPAGASMVALSSAPAAPVAASVAAPVLAQANSPSIEPIMLRDPRLDELLAARQKFGSTTALQMPARFLRNATFEAPAR